MFAYIDTFSNLIPIFLFFLYRKTKNEFKGVRLIILYLVCSFLITYSLKYTQDNYPGFYRDLYVILSEVSTFIEYGMFAGFIYYQLKSNTAKKLLLISIAAFSIFLVIFNVFFKVETFIDSIPIGVETILILGFGFYFLYEQTNDTTTLFIYTKPAFWVIFGIILYLAGSFFIYIFANYTTKKIISQYWFVTNIASIIKNIFFCIAIFINAKPSKESIKYNLELSQLN